MDRKESKVITQYGNPVLLIGDEAFSSCAYMTYFEERNDYSLFAQKGYRIYTVSVSLAAQPINTFSGFAPFHTGIFDTKGTVDFTETDEAIHKILEACPNAYIFPRIFVTMPKWWVEENPAETIPVPNGGRREILSSVKFRTDACKLLKTAVERFNTSPYADHIFGYQICGGNTQEWDHFDKNGSYSENVLPYFNSYLQKNFPSHPIVNKLPDLGEIYHSTILKDDLVKKWIRFTNDEVAETVEALCQATKEAVDYKKIVGTFYGYVAEVLNPLWGTHSMAKLIDSPNIDFFSAPNSYISSRSLGIDWGDMMPTASIKLHGKMCFIECDIRTFLTKTPGESRCDSDPLHFYTNDLWKGPETEELSANAIRKCFARQLTHKYGIWWFDMFGHWFSTDKLMTEMEISRLAYDRTITSEPFEYPTEVAVFLDENIYSEIGMCHPDYRNAYDYRTPLGSCGAPYDVYLMSDFHHIDWNTTSYKAVIFGTPTYHKETSQEEKTLAAKGIPYIAASPDKPYPTGADLTGFLQENGVFVYTDSDDVFYTGNGYLAIHAKTTGEKTITLPETLKCVDIHTHETIISDTLTIRMKQFETRIFEISKHKSERA